MKCGCGKELTKEEIKNPANKGYKDKLCDKCMWAFCHHAITGE